MPNFVGEFYNNIGPNHAQASSNTSLSHRPYARPSHRAQLRSQARPNRPNHQYFPPPPLRSCCCCFCRSARGGGLSLCDASEEAAPPPSLVYVPAAGRVMRGVGPSPQPSLPPTSADFFFFSSARPVVESFPSAASRGLETETVCLSA